MRSCPRRVTEVDRCLLQRQHFVGSRCQLWKASSKGLQVCFHDGRLLAFGAEDHVVPQLLRDFGTSGWRCSFVSKGLSLQNSCDFVLGLLLSSQTEVHCFSAWAITVGVPAAAVAAGATSTTSPYSPSSSNSRPGSPSMHVSHLC